MQILNICVKDLTPYANNPRRNDDTVSALAESIVAEVFSDMTQAFINEE